MEPSSTTRHEIVLPWYLPAIIAVGLVLAATVGAWAFMSARSGDDVLSVTGSAKQSVTSDTVKWRLDISRTVTQSGMQAGYTQIARDLETVKTFLKENGVADDAITTSTVFVEQVYKYNDSGPQEYNLRQNITVESGEVQKIDALAKNINALVSKGVFLTGNNLEFYVSSLPELRVSLLADAIKDAKARAESIASASGDTVGALKSASSGVVQVLAPNSIDVADYGQYDTQSLEKDVQVTVRASFGVR